MGRACLLLLQRPPHVVGKRILSSLSLTLVTVISHVDGRSFSRTTAPREGASSRGKEKKNLFHCCCTAAVRRTDVASRDMASDKRSTRMRIFMDIDVDESRERYRLAEWFVETWGESHGLARKGQRLEDLRKENRERPVKLREKMKAIRRAFRDSYVAQEEAKKRLVAATKRGESPLMCRTKPANERIIIEMYDDISPLATKNFCLLARGVPGEGGKIKIGKGGKPLSYVGVPFHRVVLGKDLRIIQGGDVTMHNGCGGEAAINNGKPFKDDKLGLRRNIDKRGLVCMCNTGKNTNTSQFFFTLSPQPRLKGKHVVFGEIVLGLDVLDRMEKESHPNEEDAWKPRVPVVVANAGMVP